MEFANSWFVGSFVFLGTAVVFLIICSLYNVYATQRDASQVLPPGQLINVNGHRMHLNCTGSGSPTVVLESALAGPSVLWQPMAAKISQFTRVCGYDRVGIGWSDDSAEPRTVDNITADLHLLLASSAEKGPFVFVGHSIGGMFVLDYARRYPGEVSGMVLLDSAHPERFAAGSEQWQEHNKALPLFRATPTLARLGLLRLAFWLTDKLKPLPVSKDVREQYIALASTTKSAHALKAEAEALFQLCADSKPLPNLGDRPVIVLSAARSLDEGFPARFHEEMATLSTRGIHRIVPDATHSGMALKPASMQASVEAVQQVVNSLRK